MQLQNISYEYTSWITLYGLTTRAKFTKNVCTEPELSNDRACRYNLQM